MAHVFHPLVFSPRIIESKLTCLRCFTNRIQPYGLSNRTEKQRKRFTVYSLRFQVLMLRIEPATPWQSPNKLGLCAWLKRSLQVMRFPLTSYILHHTSLSCFLEKRGFSSGWAEISKEIDGVAGCFYLGACTQGKGRRHNIRDVVSA